jgi:hypothetical protein
VRNFLRIKAVSHHSVTHRLICRKPVAEPLG